MANRNFPAARVFGFHFMPVRLDFSMSVTGSSGALASTANPGGGINSVSRLAAGVYQLQLKDNYAAFLDASFSVHGKTGASAAASAAAANSIYQINTLGTTSQAQWVLNGVPSGITAAAGVVFAASTAATASTGTGTIKPITASNLYDIEIVGNPTLMLNNQPFVAGSGGYITFQCLAPTTSAASGDPTPVVADPASGTVINGSIWLNNHKAVNLALE